MNTSEFIEIMNSGAEVIAKSETHLYMTYLSNEAMKITAELNNSYHTPEEIGALMEKLTGKAVSFRIRAVSRSATILWSDPRRSSLRSTITKIPPSAPTLSQSLSKSAVRFGSARMLRSFRA